MSRDHPDRSASPACRPGVGLELSGRTAGRHPRHRVRDAGVALRRGGAGPDGAARRAPCSPHPRRATPGGVVRADPERGAGSRDFRPHPHLGIQRRPDHGADHGGDPGVESAPAAGGVVSGRRNRSRRCGRPQRRRVRRTRWGRRPGRAGCADPGCAPDGDGPDVAATNPRYGQDHPGAAAHGAGGVHGASHGDRSWCRRCRRHARRPRLGADPVPGARVHGLRITGADVGGAPDLLVAGGSAAGHRAAVGRGDRCGRRRSVDPGRCCRRGPHPGRSQLGQGRRVCFYTDATERRYTWQA